MVGIAEARAEAVKKLDEDEKARLEVAKAKHGNPTPTQRESDLYKLGLLGLDEKEPTGAPPDPHALQNKALVASQEAAYKTREASAKK